MSDDRDHNSVWNEPNMFQGSFRPDPSEQAAEATDGSQDEISTMRDLVTNEPAFTGRLEQAELGSWLQERRSQCSIGGNLLVTVLAALIAGPFAVIGVFMSSSQTGVRLLYMILFAPIIEELLKQSGMVYLLEKKPYRVFSVWQFVAAAIISSLIFSAVENVLYIYVYTHPEQFSNPQAFALFRWTVCTPLHVACSVIASIGLINVWQRQLADGRAADLSIAYRYFIVAMSIHGIYNLAAVLINPRF